MKDKIVFIVIDTDFGYYNDNDKTLMKAYDIFQDCSIWKLPISGNLLNTDKETILGLNRGVVGSDIVIYMSQSSKCPAKKNYDYLKSLCKEYGRTIITISVG